MKHRHDPVSFKPMPARAFEPASKSARESVSVAAFLMNWPDANNAINKSIDSALVWFKINQIDGFRYKNGALVRDDEALVWYRFYDVEKDIPLFAGRDGIIRKQLSALSEERRLGYAWAGSWAKNLQRESH